MDDSCSSTRSIRSGGLEREEGVVQPRAEEVLPPGTLNTTFTTDGENVTLLNSDNQNQQYSVSSNVLVGSGGCIHLYNAGDSARLVRGGIYDLTLVKDPNRTMLIQGQLSEEYTFEELRLYQEHTYGDHLERTSIHKTWKLMEKGQTSPMLKIRLGDNRGLLLVLRHRAGAVRRFMWYDRDDKVIAIENRPGFRKAFERRTVRSQAMEQSRAGYSYADEVKHFPKLEIVAQVDDKMQDLLVAVWMARVNQEAVFLHPTTMPIRLQGNWDTNS